MTQNVHFVLLEINKKEWQSHTKNGKQSHFVKKMTEVKYNNFFMNGYLKLAGSECFKLSIWGMLNQGRSVRKVAECFAWSPGVVSVNKSTQH
jgi:hypothetical protein